MPSINGITAFIETHDGALPELGHGEFSGGKSCYIPAQSGEQFWLHYIIHKPLPCRAVSVEFYVDGQRIDAQFPTRRKFIDYPTVGPVDSTIKSQYGRGTDGNGEKVAWRREVFFTLIKPDRFAKACAAKLASESPLSKYGSIDCKVFRSEISTEWAGGVTPNELCSPSMVKVPKIRHVSHIAKLGVKMEAHSLKRFCVKSLDPDDAPFAWFKFFYRSRSCLVEKFKLNSFPEVSLRCSHQVGSISRIGQRTSTSNSTSISISPQSRTEIKNKVRTNAPASDIAKSEHGMESLIQQLEEELASAEFEVAEQKEKIINCRQKIDKLRDNSEKLRESSIQIQWVNCGGGLRGAPKVQEWDQLNQWCWWHRVVRGGRSGPLLTADFATSFVIESDTKLCFGD